MHEVSQSLFPAPLGEFVETVGCLAIASVREQLGGPGQDFGLVLRANR
jgi:hypothetical protein